MTSGVLTVLGCPILEDELIYGIANDDEDKEIFLIKTDPSKSLIEKFRRKGISYEVIDEDDFIANGINREVSGFSIVIKMMDMALHREPADLRSVIQEEVTRISGMSDVIALYYGMCGNFGWDMTRWAKENNLCPVVVFRDKDGNVCDDCIAVAIGGRKKYMELLKEHTGRMYFTPGVATNWNDFLAVNEVFGRCFGCGVEQLKWIFEQCGYDAVVEIDTGLGDSGEMRKSTTEFAETYDFRIIEADEYWPDIYPAKKIYDSAKYIMEMKTKSQN